METLPPAKKGWSLTAQAFDGLLACLDPDRERAAGVYEVIRGKLITYFESRGCLFPDDYADETINRAARKISEGAAIYAKEPASYFYGIARNLLQEYWESRPHGYTPVEKILTVKHASESPEEAIQRTAERLQRERQIECLEQCVGSLSPNDRELIVDYYQGESGIKIKNRKLLAERLSIPLNALRIRALRIRERLEECLENCLESAPSHEMDFG